MAEVYERDISARGVIKTIRLWWGDRPLLQLAAISVIAALLILTFATITASMHRLGMEPGLAYLWQSANFDITETLISYSAGDTYARAILVGLLNTLKLAVTACFLATCLGFALALMRLSGNVLLARLVQLYVEIVRNTPLVLQLFFWIALTRALPPIRQALSPLPSTFLSLRGIFLPWIQIDNPEKLLWLPVALLALAFSLRMFVKKRERPLSTIALTLLMLCFPAFSLLWIYIKGVSITPDLPILMGFNITGGVVVTPEFAAMLAGLTVHYSATISESVRSGIESVNSGQWEAGRAIGLSSARIMRLIVMPQAMRVITPLMTSSYLDLTKDTTLGILIGFTELTAVIKTSANNTGNAVDTILVLVVVFLCISLPTSFLINRYNRRLVARGGRAR